MGSLWYDFLIFYCFIESVKLRLFIFVIVKRENCIIELTIYKNWKKLAKKGELIYKLYIYTILSIFWSRFESFSSLFNDLKCFLNIEKIENFENFGKIKTTWPYFGMNEMSFEGP